MAWLDFIKEIRKDEDEEKKRKQQGGVKNSVFGFLDDVLDTTDRVVGKNPDERDSLPVVDAGTADRITDEMETEKPKPADEPTDEFVGFDMDEGKNKTIFGRDVSGLIPGESYDKTYGVKTGRKFSSTKSEFLSEFDGLDDEFRNRYVGDLQKLAAEGDTAAQHTLRTVQEAGKLKGDVGDFFEGANERFYGGIQRGALRTADFLTPGENTLGMEKLADDLDDNRQVTEAGKRGETTGTVMKGALDVATIAVPAGKIDKAVEATKFVKGLQAGNKLSKAAGYGARILPGSMAASAIDMAQEVGRGNDINVARSGGVGLATDLATPVVLRGAGKLLRAADNATGNRASGAIAKGAGEFVDAIRRRGGDVAENVDEAITPRAGAMPADMVGADVPTPPQIITRSPSESKELIGSVERGRIADQTEVIPIDRLRLGSDTLGDIDDRQVAKYVDDINQRRTIDPLVVSEKDGQLYIQDGKHRLEAMRQVGATEVPIVREIPTAATPNPNVAQSLDTSMAPPSPASVVPDAPTTGAAAVDDDVSDFAREYAADYQRPEQILDEMTDYNWQMQKATPSGTELLTKIRNMGGISRSDFESLPSTLKNKNGRAMDEIADELGFEGDQALMDAIEAAQSGGGGYATKAELREALQEQLERGQGDLIPDKDVADAYKILKASVEPSPSVAAPAQQFQDIVAAPVRPADDLAPGTGGPTRLRSFLQTAQKNTTPEGKAGLQAIEPQRYAQEAQDPVMQTAKALVDEDYSGAVKLVNSGGAWTSEKSATLMQLASKAQREGRIDDFLDLAEQIDKSGREAGRANAILAAWSRLSPEGILQFAKREIGKAGKRGVKADQLAKKIKEGVEKAGQISTDDVNKMIDDLVEGGEKSVGEKVAKNIDTYVSPQKKKQVDTLVAELTKKIKQEMIAPKVPGQKRTALDVLQEVYKRNDEAVEAFPEAQDILRAKFADNPEIMEQLDTFFKQNNIGSPAASTTLDSSIREVMKANKIKISETIKKSWDEQITDTTVIAKRLTENGFTPEQSRILAEEVGSRVKTQIAAAKKSALDRLMKTVEPRALPTYEEKIAKLSNIGALDESDYIDIARKQLAIPELDTKTATKISELAQKMQGMADGPEKNLVIRDIMETIADTMPVTKGEKFNAFRYQNLLSSPRTQLRNVAANTFNTLITRPATLFTGAVGDTASSVVTGKPRERYFRELPQYYKGIYKGFFDAQEAMQAAWKGKIDISNPDLVDQFGKGGAIQAARMRNLPKKWTVVSRLMEAQDRMFSGMIAGGEYAAQIQRGIPEEQAVKAAHEMAEYSLLRAALDPKNVNGQGAFLSAIDRGTQGIVNAANWIPGGRWIVPFVRTPLNFGKQWLEFSPVGLANATVGDAAMRRLMGDAAGMTPERRLEALNKGLLGTAVVGMGATLAADDKLTWSVPENQTDRDLFYAEGKKPYSVKIGDKWVPLINFGPFGLAMGLPAAVKHNFTDSPDSSNDNFADKIMATTLDIGEMLSQQTFLNGVGNVIEAVQGGNGKEVEKVLAGLASQAIPLSGLVRYISTAIDPTYREAEGFVQTLQRDIPYLSKGLEAQKNSVTGEDVKRNASDYVAPYSVGTPNKDPVRQANTEMAAEFYRSIRRGSNERTKTNEKITQALAANNPEEAVRLTVEHNQRVVQELMEFDAKYGKQLSGKPELQEEFRSAIQSALIPLSQRSVNTRLKNQAEKQEFSEMLNR